MGNILNIINSDKHFYDSNDLSRENYMKCLEEHFSSEFKIILQPNLVDIDNHEKQITFILIRNKNAIYSGILNNTRNN